MHYYNPSSLRQASSKVRLSPVRYTAFVIRLTNDLCTVRLLARHAIVVIRQGMLMLHGYLLVSEDSVGYL